MQHQMQQLAEKIFHTGVHSLGERERRVVQRIVQRQPISENTNQAFDNQTTFGQRLADRVAAYGGSWTFKGLFGGMLLVWIVLNSAILARRGDAFDPYPYILLNLVLSMTAALQAPIIMMAQNRQSAKDRIDAAHDYEVNLKAEIEIGHLQEKLDQLREQQWAELVAMQQEQIRLLTALLQQRDGPTAPRA